MDNELSCSKILLSQTYIYSLDILRPKTYIYICYHIEGKDVSVQVSVPYLPNIYCFSHSIHFEKQETYIMKSMLASL